MSNNTTLFVLSWDQLGLESIVNVTQIEKEKIWDVLRDNKQERNLLGSIITNLMLRARYNPQRHYEIYSINVDESITEDDLREMFDNNPQEAADLIRGRGNKIFSDRAEPNKIKIT